jgi:hypothetical protein
LPGSSSGRWTARIVAGRPRQRRRRWFSALVAGALAAELIAGTAVLIGAPAQPAPLAAPTASGASTAPPSVVVAGHTVRLAGGSGTEALLARVAADIGPAIDTVTAFWGVDWPRDITVVATGSDSQFRAEAGGGTAAQWADIAAVAVADRVDPAHRTAVGQRIVFAPGAAAMRELALRIVLSHELFHYAARVDTALDAPRWLTEGVADFVARPQTAVPEDIQLPTALPSDADLDAPGPQRSLAYDRAWWFTRFVADAYGTATLRQFYLATCGVGHADLPTAVRDVLGTDIAALLARWQRWLSR